MRDGIVRKGVRELLVNEAVSRGHVKMHHCLPDSCLLVSRSPSWPMFVISLEFWRVLHAFKTRYTTASCEVSFAFLNKKKNKKNVRMFRENMDVYKSRSVSSLLENSWSIIPAQQCDNRQISNFLRVSPSKNMLKEFPTLRNYNN